MKQARTEIIQIIQMTQMNESMNSTENQNRIKPRVCASSREKERAREDGKERGKKLFKVRRTALNRFDTIQQFCKYLQYDVKKECVCVCVCGRKIAIE